MTFEEWLRQRDPELYDELLEEGWKDWGKKAALGAAMLGTGMGIGSQFMGGDKASNQSQQQVQTDKEQQVKIDKGFWTTGTGNDRQGNPYSSEIDSNYKIALAKARNNLAGFLGTNHLPPGVEENVEEKDGVFKATVTLRTRGN